MPTVYRALRGLVLALGLAAGGAWASEVSLWFASGRPGPQAGQALDLLAEAPGHGLIAEDYEIDTLARQVGEAHRGPPPDDAAQERLAQTLSATLQRYLTDLHQGRLDPRHIDHHFKSSVRAALRVGS